MKYNTPTEIYVLIDLLVARHEYNWKRNYQADRIGLAASREKYQQLWEETEAIIKAIMEKLEVSELTLEMQVIAGEIAERNSRLHYLLSDASPPIRAKFAELIMAVERHDLIEDSDGTPISLRNSVLMPNGYGNHPLVAELLAKLKGTQ